MYFLARSSRVIESNTYQRSEKPSKQPKKKKEWFELIDRYRKAERNLKRETKIQAKKKLTCTYKVRHWKSKTNLQTIKAELTAKEEI